MSSRPDLAAIDAKVLAVVGDGAHHFLTIDARLGDDVTHWRAIDRSLQRLRRAGKIKYDRRMGWTLRSIS